VSKTAYPNTGPAGPDVDEIQPLSPEHAGLFLALDRLLTVGSYYTPEHAKYREVAQAAHKAIGENLLGGTVLQIECSNDGLWVHDRFVPREQRESRRLFDLLNDLSLGLLELRAETSAEELHETVASLKNHLIAYAGSKNFEEIEIEGLPESVTVTSQSLHVRTKDRTAGPGGTRPRGASDDYFAIPEANLVATPEGQDLEREFLGIISGIMQKSDPTRLKNLGSEEEKEEALRHWVSDSAVHTIKEIMDALKNTNSDPMIMEHLISHAQSALEMTGDPELVEMVFDRLRKETGIKSDKPKPLLSNRPKPKKPSKRPVKYTMTPEQMDEAIGDLKAAAELPEDLMAPATTDCLGICTQVLCSAPSDQMIQGISSTVFRILAVEEIPSEDLRVTVASLVAILKTGSRDMTDAAMPMFFNPLRRFNPQLVGPVWLEVWKALSEIDHKRLAWPHLVNDLLMGVQWEDPGKKIALYESLSRVNVADGSEMLERLEELKALKDEKIAPEIFHAPAPLLYPVHLVLLGSVIAREHGAKLHERLVHQRAQRLSNLLVKVMGMYKQSNKLIYQAILDQGVAERVEPRLADLGSRLLKAAVTNQDPENRDEPWVSEAITWLGKLDTKRAESLLNKIVKEKKYFFWPVWPSECRKAAKNAIANQTQAQPAPEEPAAETGVRAGSEPIDEREASGDEV
jgi:hypothetical protein